MKKYIGTGVLIFALPVFSIPQKGFKIDTQFDFQIDQKKVASKSTFILPENNKTWTSLTEPKNGVALLGRVVKSDKDSLHLEYIVVDTTSKNVVISTPAIVARLGEKAEISLGSDSSKDKVAISLLAVPTEYTEKK